MKKVKVGIIGCGNISGIYLDNLTKKFHNVEPIAVADKVNEKAINSAKKYDILSCSVDELLANVEIDIVLNLTTPESHFDINMASLLAGKHVYCEKPLAITREEGAKTVELAKKKGLLIACAPDTFLGGGLQTCIKLINDGWIGTPVAATAFMTCHGHESWHPDPEFYYKHGAGPMFDMGPYYLTALVAMLGSIKRVCGSTGISFSTRTITSAEKYGTVIEVEVPTHITGIMDFKCGAIGTIITTFDVWAAELPRIEIYGSEASLSVPDPNTFGGPVRIKSHRSNEWQEVPLTHGFAENSRGVGVSDMANAIIKGNKNRANGDLAYHVLDVMQGFSDASNNGVYYKTISNCDKPEPFPMGISEHDTK
ncbi:MAG: Gfo/Idh/MocA family oxidoreductase [Oscillospiraceae bacterium]|jgi:predicted dehydrogenase|nr:Gfo/Idh/MocA family oxidoreductase [Oscillospiraceae bacterium]